MPSIETADLHDWAVLWEPAGVNNYGDQTIESPREIRCRWEDTQHEALNSQSKSQGFDAVVVVGCDIPIDSILWLGRLNCVPGTAETPEDSLYKVVRKSAIPDIKRRNFRRVIYLVRFNNTLPTIEP